MSPEVKAKGQGTCVTLEEDLLILGRGVEEVWVFTKETVKKAIKDYLKLHRGKEITISPDDNGKIVAFDTRGDGRVNELGTTTIYHGEIIVATATDIIQSI